MKPAERDQAKLDATQRAIAKAGGLQPYLAQALAAGRLDGSIPRAAVERVFEQRKALLVACRLALRTSKGPLSWTRTQKVLRAAIAKAEGR